MKWAKYIVEESDPSDRAPTSHLETSRRSSRSKGKPFLLKSCDRAKMDSPFINSKDVSIIDQQNLGSSSIKKMISRISPKGETVSSANRVSKDKDIQTIKPFSEPQELLKLTDVFYQEFQKFLRTFFTTYENLRVRRNQEETLKKKITEILSEGLTKYIKQCPSLVFKSQSPLRKPILNSPVSRKASRAIQFKNQKIHEKDGMADVHESINEVHRILESNQREHRFSRTSMRTKPKRDRSLDSSVEDIMERSFNDSHRNSKSRLKAHQALYRFNQVLNAANM